MTKKMLFGKDFLMVLIGQIISLFGNAIIRFALPLYLLDKTHSPALFGLVGAIAFIPMILLSPVGGFIADRVNKRNIMVILDFSTSAIVAIILLTIGMLDVFPVVLVAMIFLFGIQGAYQPAVQASIPVLVGKDGVVPANAAVNLVSSIASLAGPIVGGAVYAAVGINPILIIGAVCFLFSAVMEIVIHSPYEKRAFEQGLLKTAAADMGESFRFMTKGLPIAIQITLIIAAINCFFSAMIMVGLPIMVKEVLPFGTDLGSQLYGFAEGALALGSVVGGILTGVIMRKMRTCDSYKLLFPCAFTLVPIALALLLPIPPMVSYIIITICCFLMMILVTMFSIKMMAWLQIVIPEQLLGKIIACVMCISGCAQPIGQCLYGLLFEYLKGHEGWIVVGAFAVSIFIIGLARGIYRKLPDENSVRYVDGRIEPIIPEEPTAAAQGA